MKLNSPFSRLCFLGQKSLCKKRGLIIKPFVSILLKVHLANLGRFAPELDAALTKSNRPFKQIYFLPKQISRRKIIEPNFEYKINGKIIKITWNFFFFNNFEQPFYSISNQKCFQLIPVDIKQYSKLIQDFKL